MKTLALDEVLHMGFKPFIIDFDNENASAYEQLTSYLEDTVAAISGKYVVLRHLRTFIDKNGLPKLKGEYHCFTHYNELVLFESLRASNEIEYFDIIKVGDFDA